MALVNIFNILRGYVIILVEGYFLERFINICARRQIYLWDIHMMNAGTMKLKVSIPGFKALRPIAKKTRCRVTMLHKKGMPFLVFRHRRRKTFAIGVLLFFSLIWFMTSFVWIIDVKGNEFIKSDEIMMYLQREGLEEGSFKLGLDLSEIENKIMLQTDKLSWIGIEIVGTKALVEIKERRIPPKILEKHIPCDIVAEKDGVIHNLVVKSGFPVVNEGDTVEAGQLLVSGVIDSKIEGIRYIHSTASVKARTWYEKTKEVSLIKVHRIKTGKRKKQYTLKFMNYNVNLFLNSGIPYANYDKMTGNKALTIGKENVLPIQLETALYEEVELEEEKISAEQAIEEGATQLQQEIAQELEGNIEILDEKVDYIFIHDNNVFIQMTIEGLEEIGIQEEIMK